MSILAWSTIEQGTVSGIGYVWRTSFRCELEWQKVWQWHAKPRMLIRTAPAVDFKREMVIALFSGARNRCSGVVSITEVQESDHYIFVLYKDLELNEVGISEVHMRPFHIVRTWDRLKPLRFERVQ